MSVATLSAIATWRAFPPICLSPYGWELSQNGKWIAFTCLGEEQYEANIVKISSLDKHYQWKLVYGKTIGTEKEGPWGHIYPFHWSIDGRYLYLTHMAQGDGVWSFRDGDGLLRLELFTGKVIEVLQKSWYSFSFSPKDNLLVYDYNLIKPQVIHILNVTNGEKQEIDLGPQYIEAGSFVWSPDQKILVFEAASGDLQNEQMSLMLIDLKTWNLKTLVEVLPPDLYPTKYQQDGTILLENYDQTKILKYDLEINRLTPVD